MLSHVECYYCYYCCCHYINSKHSRSGTVSNSLLLLTHLSQTTASTNCVFIIIMLWMKKQKQGMVRWLAWDFLGSKWWIPDSAEKDKGVHHTWRVGVHWVYRRGQGWKAEAMKSQPPSHKRGDAPVDWRFPALRTSSQSAHTKEEGVIRTFLFGFKVASWDSKKKYKQQKCLRRPRKICLTL